MDLPIRKSPHLYKDKATKSNGPTITKDSWWWIVGIVLFILFSCFVFSWLSRDMLAPHWDEARHLRNTLLYYDFLRSGDLVKFFFSHYAYYPPAVYQITAVLYVLFGRQESIASLSMVIWTGIAYWALLFLLKQYFGRAISLATGFLYLCTPLVFHMTHDFLLDVPLIAMVLLFLLVCSKKPFDSPTKAVALGAIAAIGMLVKWTFVLYVFAPFLLLIGILIHTKQLKKSLIPLFLFFLVACLLAGGWFGSHGLQLWQDFRHQVDFVAVQEGDPSLWTLDSTFYYLAVLCNDYIGLGLFSLFLIGIYSLAKTSRTYFHILFVLLIPSYLVITAISNKDPRYLFPLLPFFLLPITWMLFSKRTKIRCLLILGVLLFSCVQVLAGLGNTPFPQEKIAIPSPFRYVAWYEKQDPPVYFSQKSIIYPSRFGEINLYNPFSYIGKVPRQTDWKNEVVITTIVEKGGSPNKLCLLSGNMPFFNSDTLSYAYAKRGFMKAIDAIKIDEVSYCNILVLRPSGLLSGDERALLTEEFTLLEDTIQLPDSTNIEIYRK